MELTLPDVYLRTLRRVVAGSPVRLELDEILWLGEVIECQPDADGHKLWMRVEQELSGLGRLATALAEKAWPVPANRAERG